MSRNSMRMTTADYFRRLRTYFIAGLLVLIPIYITISLTVWAYSLINDPVNDLIAENTDIPAFFQGMFQKYAPGWLQVRMPEYEGHVPGLGLVITILLILGIGLFAKNYLGGKVIGHIESMLSRLPLISRIYKGAKQVSEVFLQRNKDVFQAAVLVEYPRKGVWSIGFLTQTDSGEISEKLGADMACIFMSTTPNPTSGFFVLIPKNELIVLDMTIEEAVKMIISGGLVTPKRMEEYRAVKKLEERASKEESAS